MYVICKSCEKKFKVFPPSGDLNLGGENLDLGSNSIDVNKITFGDGGRINFGDGGKINFRSTPPAKYKCPYCGEEFEYAPNEIFDD